MVTIFTWQICSRLPLKLKFEEKLTKQVPDMVVLTSLQIETMLDNYHFSFETCFKYSCAHQTDTITELGLLLFVFIVNL